ncbi:MAG: peptidoglycan DD-metalloendopeptidase family protein [Parcubacteria group bacterium]|nr:peptidoglycan DD-metalloendopeptidase family protein [Parcubacteria group bacterium]
MFRSSFLSPRLRTCCLIFVAVLIGIAPVARGVFGARVDDLKEQILQKERVIRELEAQAAAYKKEIAAREREAQTLQNQIRLLDARIRQLATEITITEDRIEQTNLQIAELEVEITQKEAEIQREKLFIGEAIRSIHSQDEQPVLATLLGEPTLSAVFNQMQYTETLQSSLQEALDVVQELKVQLETEKHDREAKKVELESLRQKLTAQRSAESSVRTERTEVLTDTRNEEKRYQQLLRDVNTKQKQIAREIYELEEALRRTLDPGRIPGAMPGVLTWPTEGLLTQGYGPTSQTGFVNNVYNFHNGLDIASGYGSPIHASRDGKVIATGNTGKYAYGKWVAIEHDNNLTTLYAHLSSVSVSRSERVKRGAVIGLEGSTGFSTGSHLHFTVYDSSTFRVMERSYGLLPLGASINPMKYLPSI